MPIVIGVCSNNWRIISFSTIVIIVLILGQLLVLTWILQSIWKLSFITQLLLSHVTTLPPLFQGLVDVS